MTDPEALEVVYEDDGGKAMGEVLLFLLDRRKKRMDEADRADAELAERLDAEVRRDFPQAFTKKGRLRSDVLRSLRNRFGGTRLSQHQVDDVIAAARDIAAQRKSSQT